MKMLDFREMTLPSGARVAVALDAAGTYCMEFMAPAERNQEPHRVRLSPEAVEAMILLVKMTKANAHAFWKLKVDLSPTEQCNTET